MEKTRVVLLGASGGIGSALCRKLAGVNLVLAGRSQDRLQSLSQELSNSPFFLVGLFHRRKLRYPPAGGVKLR